MGILARVHEARSYTIGNPLKDPELAKFYSSGRTSIAGPIVNEMTALVVGAFWDGVDQIASDVAKLPLNLLKRRKEGGAEPYSESRTYRLMKFSPNPDMRSMVLRRTMTAHAVIYGNGYAEIERDQGGKPVALWLLHPTRVQPFYDRQPNQDGRRFPLRYKVDGGKVTLDAHNILHLPGLSDDGAEGFNLVTVAREALGLAMASQQFAAAFFGNGTRFGGVLSAKDQDLDEDQAKDIREKIEELHSKADKAFRLLVLGAGFDYTPVGIKPNEAQMKEIRDQQVAEVARYLHMPLHKLKLAIPGAVSYASVEMADLDYYKGTLLTWITGWEEELNAKLIPSLELGLQFFKHNANAFLRGDIKSRYEALGIARDKGIINADEWRDLEDMNPQPDGQGKLYLVQSAQIPVDRLAALADAQIQAAKPPAPTAPTDDPDVGAVIDDALDRARRATELAEAARGEAQTEREARVALEASGAATAEQLAQAMIREQGATARAAHLEVLAESRRVDQASIAAARDALVERLAVEEAARRLADDAARAREAEAQAAETAQLDAEARAAADAARAAAADAARLVAETTATAATEARHAAEANEAAARAAVAALETAQVRLSGAVSAADERDAAARAEADRLAAAVAAALARAETLDAELATVRQQLQAATAESATATGSLTAERDALQDQAAQLEAARAALAASAEALEARAAAATAAQTATEQALQTARRQELDRLTAVLAAHRGLFIESMGRMVRWETSKARRHQATPEKLRAWIDSFYVTHEDTCCDALLPAVRVHLAWQQSAEDPMAVTRALVREHVAESVRQLRAVAGGDPEDLHVTLERMLQRWEDERPAALADRILHEEIEHVRTYQI